MANLSAASRRNSAASSAANSPRPSLSAARLAVSIEETKTEEVDEKNRGRMCSERSDSGISDCSTATTASFPSHTCDSILEEDTPEKTEDINRRTSVEMDNKVDDIRKKFASFSENICEMDRKLEDVSKQLDDIRMIKITPQKSVSPPLDKRNGTPPSIKDMQKKSLMQPTASSQSKVVRKTPDSPIMGRSSSSKLVKKAPDSPVLGRSPTLTSSQGKIVKKSPDSPVLSRTLITTVPKSPELKTRVRSRDHTPPPKTNGGSRINSDVCVVGGKAGGLSNATSTKRADFLRLQQRFSNGNMAAKPSPVRSEHSPPGSTAETLRSRTSPTFQKTVAFWKR